LYNIRMTPQEKLDPPFKATEHGSIRIGNSRVTLDSVINEYKLGATAEQIAYSFPSLQLSDIYLTVAYYLIHKNEIEAYLAEQEKEANELRQHIESSSEYQKTRGELRERILARWEAQQRDVS
jgi:uncharacterized protein (DUF433 family)